MSLGARMHETYAWKLPDEQEEFITLLAKNKLIGLGHTRGEVLRSLVDMAIRELVNNEYVQKAIETKKLLGKP